MPTLEALSKQIETTADMRSIVRTMKALAAVSIQQFERASAAVAEYERTVDLGFQVLLRHTDAPLLRGEVAEGDVGIVVLGSDHGLCGRFNDQVAAAALELMPNAAGGRCRILAVGLRAAARLEASGHRVDDALQLPGSANGLAATVQAIVLTIDRWRTDLGVERIHVCHNRRTERVVARPEARLLWPLDLERLRELAARPWPTRSLPTFTMDPVPLFAALVRQHLVVALLRACAESLASEHASRLASMQSAERNIADRLEEMRSEFRHLRQESITEELLDVVAGFEVLRHGSAR